MIGTTTARVQRVRRRPRRADGAARARAQNASLGRWENLWSSEKPSVIALASDEDVLEKMAYTIANPTARRPRSLALGVAGRYFEAEVAVVTQLSRNWSAGKSYAGLVLVAKPARTTPRSRWSLLFVGAACITLAAGVAQGHPGHKRSSRLIEVDLAGAPATLKYGYVFEESASVAARKEADVNGGGVSVEEGKRALERWGNELVERLEICRGPSLEALHCSKLSKGQLRAANATAWEQRLGKPLALVWEFELELDAGDRAFEVRDTEVRPEIDRTDATLVPPRGARLGKRVSNSHTIEASGQLVVSWDVDSPQEVRRIVGTWEPPLQRWIVLSVVGAVGALMTLQLVATWRRRRHHVPVTKT